MCNMTCLIALSQYRAERTASMCQVSYSCSIPCEAWASMRPVVRPIPLPFSQHSCRTWVPVTHAPYFLLCTPCHASVLCRASLRAYRSTSPLPYCPSQYPVASSVQRMATVVLHLVSARRGSVGRPCESLDEQKSRLCGSRRNRANSGVKPRAKRCELPDEPKANMFVWHTIGQMNMRASEQAVSEWANGERTDVREPKKLRFGTNPKANEQWWIGRVESFLRKIFAGKQWKNQ